MDLNSCFVSLLFWESVHGIVSNKSMVTSLSCRAPHYNTEFPVDLGQVHSAHKLLFSRDLLQQVFSNMYLRLFFKCISRRGALPDWQIHGFSLLIAYHLSFLILYTYFNCRYLVVKFAYNSSGATWWSNSSGGTWWPNVQPIQAPPPGGRIWNYQLSHQRHVTYWLCDLYEESLQVYT